MFCCLFVAAIAVLAMVIINRLPVRVQESIIRSTVTQPLRIAQPPPPPPPPRQEVKAVECSVLREVDLGILKRDGDRMRLFGVPRDRRRLRFCYFAVDADHFRYEVVFNGETCGIDRCCGEVHDQDVVQLRGTDGDWIAYIDKNQERKLWS